jgi:Lon protease-like protein
LSMACQQPSSIMRMMMLWILLLQQHISCCLGGGGGGWNAAAARRFSSLGFVAPTMTTARQRPTAGVSSPTRLWDVPYEDGFGSGKSNNKRLHNKNRKNPMEIVRSLQESFYSSPASTSLSSSYYTPQHATFRGDTVENLPLWRAAWQEVPGRSNILHLSDAMYTNMMEQILHQPPHTWYIGHLYSMPTTTMACQNLKSSSRHNPRHQLLRAWDNDAPMTFRGNSDDESTYDDDDASASCCCLGTLLRIADYRRLVDGRLVVLVQAMERFVVTRVQQHVPYGRAMVQLLPDLEEVDDDYNDFGHGNDAGKNAANGWVHQRTEWDVTSARALALQESFQKWHRYEYENTLLPLPLRSQDLEESDLVASTLLTVLPLAPYSSTINVTRLAAESMEMYSFWNDDDDEDARSAAVDDESTTLSTATSPTTPTLEQRLMEVGILLNETLNSLSSSSSMSSSSLSSFIHSYLMDSKLVWMKLSSNELEFRLWWALNDFLKTTRTPVSPILLGLLPPLSTWDVYMDQYGSVDDIVIHQLNQDNDTPSGNDKSLETSSSSSSSSSFVLHRIAQAIQEQTQLHHKYVAVDEAYPALRRQKRLSYSAAYVLETLLNPEAITALRKVLLQIPSTRQRLAFVYQMLQTESCAPFQ